MNIVTGAFGYIGRYIAGRLLDMGEPVTALTGRPDRPNPFGSRVRAIPFAFDDPAAMAEGMRGATTLYNTYWVRFPRGELTHERAVRNSIAMFDAARQAGVRRIVHVSITGASSQSRLSYFRGKGELQEALSRLGLSYVIVRPTVVFGREDILVNNIAWILRRFPVFGLPGRGDYRLQPVSVDDVAELAVEAGHLEENVALDAVGPETYTFRELVEAIARSIGRAARLVPLPPRLAYLAAWGLGRLVNDVVLTWDEVEGLMAGLLVSEGTPTGRTRLSQWLAEHADGLGVSYASEMARHYR